jgi:hypothetical protein
MCDTSQVLAQIKRWSTNAQVRRSRCAHRANNDTMRPSSTPPRFVRWHVRRCGSRQATRKTGLGKSHPSEANNQLTPFVDHNHFVGVTFLFALHDRALLAVSRT